MYPNIDNLLTTIDEANKNIENTKRKTQAIKQNIKDCDQAKYKRFIKWVVDLQYISKKIQDSSTYLYLPGINDTYLRRAKVYLSASNTLELGMYAMPSKYENNEDNWKVCGVWLSWVFFDRFYENFKSQLHCGNNEKFFTEIINNWDKYEEDFYLALEDYAIRALAAKADKVNKEYTEAKQQYEKGE